MKKIIRKIIERFGYHLINKVDNPGTELIGDIKRFYRDDQDILIFDVGANTGQSALSFTKSFPYSSIHSFEPTPKVFSILEKSVRDKKNIFPHNLACSSKDEKLQFNTFKTSVNNSMLSANYLEGETIEVQACRLDTFCMENNCGDVNILKVDAQGYDLEVLKGANVLLDENKIGVICIELLLKEYYENQSSFEEIYIFLKNKGYRLYGLYERWYDYNGIDHCDGLFINSNFINA